MRTIVAVAGILIVLFGSCYAVRFFQRAEAAVTRDKHMATAYVPDANNRVVFKTRGWNRTELDRILTDFRKLYELRSPSDWVVAETSPDSYSVTFPSDIEPKLLYFLVNYTRYPRGFDLEKRSIGAVAKVVLSGAYGIPDPSMNGVQATIYVPANDTDYDYVCVRLQSGLTYRIPFTDLNWEPAEDAPMPAADAGL